MHVDLILQGKGGVGKSLIASLIAQHLRKKGCKLSCVDTDPENATFAGYQALGAETLEIMDGEDINPREFDGLIERIVMAADPEERMVIDSGTSTFLPLCSYLLRNQVVPLLKDSGHSITFHVPITGGQALLDTAEGFAGICSQFKNVPVVVWQNEYFGPVVHEGKKFEESKGFKEFGKRIQAIVTIPALQVDTFGYDFRQMLAARLTFAEADQSPAFTFMARHRLRKIADAIFGQMDRAGL